MYTHKFLMRLLMAATVLALLLTACAPKNEIQSNAGQALVEQGDAFMTCMQASDFNCAYALMSPAAQKQLDKLNLSGGGMVNVESVIDAIDFDISRWTFERAQFSTSDGVTTGTLTGTVEFEDGKQGQVKLEFEKDGETWKVRSSGIE
jgi:hypothetical protein